MMEHDTPRSEPRDLHLDLHQGAVHWHWNERVPQELRLWVTEGATRLTLADLHVLQGYLYAVEQWIAFNADIAEWHD